MGKVKNKWDSLDANVQKWATRLGAIATIVGVLVAGGGWLIHQLDNAVATRLESQTSEIQTQVKELADEQARTNKQTELQLTRLELLSLMESDPENVVEIEKVARHYFQTLKGNAYMSSMYTKYCKQYNADCEIMFR